MIFSVRWNGAIVELSESLHADTAVRTGSKYNRGKLPVYVFEPAPPLSPSRNIRNGLDPSCSCFCFVPPRLQRVHKSDLRLERSKTQRQPLRVVDSASILLCKVDTYGS